MSAIVKAIAKIMAEVGSVQKAGTNTFHNYRYATAADVLHKLQPLMANAGLVIIQNEAERRFDLDGAVLTVSYEFTLAHESGELWQHPIVRTGMAAAKNSKGGFDDKALNKCSTAALKYFLLTLFQIPTGDYDDADKDEDRPARAPNGNGARRVDPVAREPFGLEDTPEQAESRNRYLAQCREYILNPVRTEAEVRHWWSGEAQARRDFGLSQTEVNLLKSVIAERFKKEAAA